jgi:sortase (surface protein transpeptidase)
VEEEQELFGEMPTTGGMRPGPVGLVPSTDEDDSDRVRPIAIRIPSIGVDTEIEFRGIVEGRMLDPTTPWVIAWYPALGWLGEEGNVVLSGHVDFHDVGPAVLWRASELQPGDQIEVTGHDVAIYTFEVEWNQLVDAANPPMDEITGHDAGELLTVITCGGTFDPSTQSYLERRIIRARRA